jgi:hypothetical protein
LKRTVNSNSTPIARQKILGVISANHAEKLLLDWVNLQNTPKALNRMRLQHPQVFSFLGQDGKGFKELVGNVKHFLRLAWDAPDSRHRDWQLFRARYVYGQAANGVEFVKAFGTSGEQLASQTYPGVPDETPFEAAMFYLTRLTHRMLHCPNPDCAAPYFFKPIGTKVQKFCSPECANPSRRESKRRWHRENRGKGATR